MIKHIKGDALEWARKEGHVMIHCCNAQGKMGSGVALQVKQQFPADYQAYLKNHALGEVTTGSGDIYNLVCQENYGYDGKRYLSYKYLILALETLVNEIHLDHYNHLTGSWEVDTIVVPYKFGSERAGGDWDVILEILDAMLSNLFNILVVEWEPKEL